MPKDIPPALKPFAELAGQLLQTVVEGAAEALLSEVQTGLHAVEGRIAEARVKVAGRRRTRRVRDEIEGEVVETTPRRARRRSAR